MPVYLDDPSVLTKERLKSELRAHNVELPGGNPTKDVYVQLYVKTVSAQSHGTEALDAFSSDEELPPPLVSQTRRSRSSGRKSEAVALERLDTAQMSDEDLREQLLKQGVDAGPIVASTRKLYERKLLKLLDNEAILSESQSYNNSGETEVYSDQEEEVPAAPEPEPAADVELEPAPVRSSSSHPPSAQRHSSSSQHSITKHMEQVEKKTAVEDTAPPELSAFTGLTATCRQPIKGAAGLPLKHDTTDSFQSQTSVCNSASTTACSAPSTTSSTPSAASSAPSAASSAFSSASSAPSTACQAEACGVSWWKKLLLLLVLLLFVFLVYQAMEPNGAAPSEQEEL